LAAANSYGVLLPAISQYADHEFFFQSLAHQASITSIYPADSVEPSWLPSEGFVVAPDIDAFLASINGVWSSPTCMVVVIAAKTTYLSFKATYTYGKLADGNTTMNVNAEVFVAAGGCIANQAAGIFPLFQWGSTYDVKKAVNNTSSPPVGAGLASAGLISNVQAIDWDVKVSHTYLQKRLDDINPPVDLGFVCPGNGYQWSTATAIDFSVNGCAPQYTSDSVCLTRYIGLVRLTRASDNKVYIFQQDTWSPQLFHEPCQARYRFSYISNPDFCASFVEGGMQCSTVPMIAGDTYKTTAAPTTAAPTSGVVSASLSFAVAILAMVWLF